ncbi:MAG: mannose-1-phosphate guanylyltransferase, partial [Propionibacteriaceae bacterium]|nr:mannose-1-phosphate guanylyltransferase [Propionibacteriaceae bacterium]
VVALDSSGNVVVNADSSGLIGLIGVRDLVVVRTGSATLVVPLSQAERVKELVAEITAQAGPQFA